MLLHKQKLFLLFFAGFTYFLLSVGSVYATNRPLKILFVVSHFPSPSQIFILNMITGLIDRGHKVSIFSFHNDSELMDVHPHIKQYNLLGRVIYEKFPEKLPDCDIVFCQFGYLGKKILAMKPLRKWLKKRKFIVCFRGADITKRTQVDAKIYAQVFESADLILPVCDYFKKRLIALGCNSNKIVVHHSAIDCSQFDFAIKTKNARESIHLISVCRLVKKKGIDFAIRAMSHVIKKDPNIYFTIVGDGPEKTYLQFLIKQLKLEDRIILYGWATQQEVISLLKRSHIFLLPSRTGPDGNEEGIANALKEAMAMGLISIGTWHAGTPELIEHDKTGFLVSEKSIVPLAHTIEYIIEHEERWETIALAARKKIEDEFETKHCVMKLEKLFYELLNSNKTKTI